MDLTVVTKTGTEGKEFEVDGLVHKHLAKKLEKIETRLGKPLVARVVLEELPVGFEATVTLQGGLELIGKANHEDLLLKAVDLAVDKVTRQFESQTDKETGRERQRRASGTIKASTTN